MKTIKLLPRTLLKKQDCFTFNKNKISQAPLSDTTVFITTTATILHSGR